MTSLRLGDIFCSLGMQDDDLSVACHLHISVRFVLDLTEMVEQSVNVAPPEIVGDWMLEDRLVGTQMHTSESCGGIHIFLATCITRFWVLSPPAAVAAECQ
jgi:hypothetical protein